MERELIQKYAKEVLNYTDVESMNEYDYRFISNSLGFAVWVLRQLFIEFAKLIFWEFKYLLKKYAR